MRSWRSAIVLAVVLGGLGGLAYWDEWKSKVEEKEEKDKNKLVDFALGEIERVEYAAKTLPSPIVLELIDKQWVITAPVRAKAEQSAVTSLLQAIVDYKYESVVSQDAAGHEQYGLKDPERKITLTKKDKKLETVYIGAKAPVGYSVYVRTDASPKSYIGSQHLYTSTEKKLADFRDKTLMDIKEESLISFELKNKKIDVRLERKKTGEPIALVKPQSLPADSDAFADFVNTLKTEKVEDFVDQPEKALTSAFGEGKRYASIQWQTADGEKKSMLFAEYDKKFWASADPANLVYKLSDTFKSKLDKDVMSFRDKQVLKLDSASINEVEVDGESFVRKGGDWVKKSDKKSAKANHIQNLIVDLEFAKTEKFLTAKDVGSVLSTAPKHRIKLLSEKDKKPAVLTIDVFPDPKQESFVYVKHSGEDTIYSVNKTTFDNVSEKKKEDAPPPPSNLESEDGLETGDGALSN